MVICLERDADLHMVPLPLTVSCFSIIQIGFTFLVPAHLGSPGKGPLNWCLFVCLLAMIWCPFVSFHHKPVLYLNGQTDQAAFVAQLPLTYLTPYNNNNNDRFMAFDPAQPG